jgi:hypothetical protein
MTMEAIRGFEYVTFEQRNADEEPAHSTIIPFTAMFLIPWTPGLPIGSAITSMVQPAFELALSVCHIRYPALS